MHVGRVWPSRSVSPRMFIAVAWCACPCGMSAMPVQVSAEPAWALKAPGRATSRFHDVATWKDRDT